jgi:hypothetical protein
MLPQLMRTSVLALTFVVVFHCLVVPVFGDISSIDFARLASLTDTNPFRANLARNISVNDDLIKQSLWKQHKRGNVGSKKRGPTIIQYKLNKPKDGSLAKRVDEKNPPIINLRSCLFCEGKAKSTATVDMGDRT